MPKTCKPNRSLKVAAPWSVEEALARRAKKIEKIKRKHISDTTTEDDDINADNTDNIPFNLKRQMLLAHDSEEKQEKDKMRLHITKLNREIELLRDRLTNWDEKEEEEMLLKQQKEEEERKRKEEELLKNPNKKKRRPGPETWKLRGAARPAWEVYDFDTRYVCPHIKEHEDAKEKVKRIQNILLLCRGKIQDGPKPHCYNFITYLCHLGHLYHEEKKYSKARQVWIECIDLEDVNVVMCNARYRLLRMYMHLARMESAKRLCNDLSTSTTKSAWIQYSTLLLAFKKNKSSQDSSSQELDEAFQNAMDSNIYCIFYLSFHDTAFNKDVMEYSDDIEDVPEGTLLEAIEYCNSEQLGIWLKTDGAIEWLRKKLNSVWKGLDWESSLKKEVEESNTGNDEQMDEEKKEENIGDDVQEDDEEEEEEENIDVSMYAGMFRTGMEMLIENGQLK